MRPAPTPNEDEAGCEEDGLVADPLPEQMVELWNKTARKNREIFTEIFRPVPTNLVRDWEAYDVRLLRCRECVRRLTFGWLA
jgi:phospholipase D1/2